LCASPASAQGAAPRGPTGGLFGPTRSDVGSRDRLNFTFETAEGYDTAVPVSFRSQVPQDAQADGWSTIFAAHSDYQRKGSTLEIAGTARSAVRYYHAIDRLDTLGQAAGLGIGIKLPKQTNFKVDSTAAYSPSYLYQLFPVGTPPALGEAIPTNPDYQIADHESYTYRTRAELSFGSRLGTMLTTSGEFNRTEFNNESAPRAPQEFYETGIKLSHGGRGGGVSAGYYYRGGRFRFDGFTAEHRVSIGGEYSTALSRTRRATVRFTLTPSRLDVPPEALRRVADEEASGPLYRLNGEAGFTYPFRVNWRMSATYRREVEYLPIFLQPVFSDGARAELSGLISRRLDLAVRAAYAEGASVFQTQSKTIETYTGEVMVRFALKRWVALCTEYLFYEYDLGSQALVQPGLPGKFKQHGVRVGFQLFLETLGR
jgi:hypothetical protein